MSSIAQKLLSILTPSERRQAIVLLGLMLVGMVLETLGVGLVIPALALLTQPDTVSIGLCSLRFLGVSASPRTSRWSSREC
jgi:hypothetical protein